MDYIKVYVKFLKRFIKIKHPLRIVFDCSNGTAGLVLKKLFKGDGRIKTILINSEPNGNFPSHGPNPLADGALKQLQKEVINKKADLGVIFDGDGDRVFFVDDKGKKIDPDIIGFILIKGFKPPYIISTTSSWRIKNVKKSIVSKVGHLFMKTAMLKNKANLGIERSGHYCFKDFFNCDSGIFTAIQVINVVCELKTKISDYIKRLPNHFQMLETNFEIKIGDDAIQKIKNIEDFYKKSAQKILKNDGLLMEFSSPKGKWWISLRPSNTENLLRLTMEAEGKKLLKEKFKEVKKYLKRE